MARSKLSSGKIDGPAAKVLQSISQTKTRRQNLSAFQKLAGMFGLANARALVCDAGKAGFLPKSCMG